ncbi:related to zinc transporter [Cephalotrichum gorgonifer]|uniref:Related to zinc transporter n=1 Tax=Cephalotrichum gorgonifer TaxID=2041049 RepID=A0AAE8MW38_9PEZI|nr:related to zinc transporter [Cephalotrichum gorgonifer]
MALTRAATGLLPLLLLGSGVLGAALEPTPVQRTRVAARQATAAVPDITAVSDCHPHKTDLWCMDGTAEYQVGYTVTNTAEYPAEFTSCHAHGTDLFCEASDGTEAQVLLGGEEDADADADHEGHDEHEGEEGSEPAAENCHFHAGVEHCVAAGESESGSESESSTSKCEKVHRDYNIPLRIGLIFVVLATSSLGVFAPILLARFLPNRMTLLLILLKQFGTGIIIATALVHLFVHAMLMFQNSCIEGIEYEGTAAAICMAGVFISFLIEYLGNRYLRARLAKKLINASPEDCCVEKHNAHMEMMNINIMEAGIIFHSIIIGVTLVVAGDSFFITLFIVIVFHQFFEGLALGSRIAELGTGKHLALSALGHHHHHAPAPEHATESHSHPKSAGEETAPSVDSESDAKPGKSTVPMWHKIALAGAFALVTPIGMAIGTGALSHFNGNDQATAIAIGTLDALSAGILLWVGVVEMWASDWMGGELSDASPLVTTLGLASLMLGMGLMSFLGKWA